MTYLYLYPGYEVYFVLKIRDWITFHSIAPGFMNECSSYYTCLFSQFPISSVPSNCLWHTLHTHHVSVSRNQKLIFSNLILWNKFSSADFIPEKSSGLSMFVCFYCRWTSFTTWKWHRTKRKIPCVNKSQNQFRFTVKSSIQMHTAKPNGSQNPNASNFEAKHFWFHLWRTFSVRTRFAIVAVCWIEVSPP